MRSVLTLCGTVAVACLLSFSGIGAFACALGLVVALESPVHTRRVALACVLVVCVPAYAFILKVAFCGDFAFLGVLGFLASLVLALLPAALALGLTARFTRSLEGRAFVLPLSWALASAIVPSVFPFRPAYLAVTTLPLAQWLSIGGPTLLDAIVIGLGTSLVVFVRGSRVARGAAALFIVVSVGGGFGLLAHARSMRRPSVTVGIVSPAITLAEGRDPSTRRTRLARLHALTARVQHADLVVWPESTYPYPIRPDAQKDAPAPYGANVGARMLVGAAVGDEGCRRASSFVAIGEHGGIVGRADKARLMPFGDVVPMRFIPAVARRFPCGTREGERFSPLRVGRLVVGALLCFDEVDPGPARERVRAGANVLVSGANDAWYAHTSEPELHARVARARAIETRRDLVRAVNMGEGGLIASSGDVYETMHGAAEARLVRVALSTWISPFVRYGHFVAPLFALILGVFLRWAILGRRRAAAQTPA